MLELAIRLVSLTLEHPLARAAREALAHALAPAERTAIGDASLETMRVTIAESVHAAPLDIPRYNAPLFERWTVTPTRPPVDPPLTPPAPIHTCTHLP